MWNHAWKIALTVALAIGGYFELTPNSQKAQKMKQPVNTPSKTPTASRVEGGITINNHNNYSPQPLVSLPETQQPIPTKQEEIAQTNITQETNGDGNCPVVNNGENNLVNSDCSITKIEKIEKQTDNTRNVQAEQYIEKTGENNTNCAGNDNSSACGNGTININPR